MSQYIPNENRYQEMAYQRCGHSGLKLPRISLGLWHNFGGVDVFSNSRDILLHAFDSGVTHFDLANNYGPPPGSAEETFGRVLNSDLKSHRDELIISTKAGYTMWPGPYGDHGSKKYLIASLDQSLRRMQLDYADIFYHHRPDADTPMEETAEALIQTVRQGKALYVGLSNYKPEQAEKMFNLLAGDGIHCLIHQPKYSMFERWIENGLLDTLEKYGVGCIPFSPLAQGLLTDKYLGGIPPNSRAARQNSFLKMKDITPEKLLRIKKLNEHAGKRGQSLAQMAIAWILKDPRITTVLIGASSPEQVSNCITSLKNTAFTSEELQHIEEILTVTP